MPNRRLDENYRPDYRLPAYSNDRAERAHRRLRLARLVFRRHPDQPFAERELERAETAYTETVTKGNDQ